MNEKDRAHQSTQVIVYCTKQMSRVCIVFQIVKNVSSQYLIMHNYQQISKSQQISVFLSKYQQLSAFINGLNGH